MQYENPKESYYNVRRENLLKLNKPFDLKIYISECGCAINKILDQLKHTDCNKIWEEEANFALKDIQRRGELAQQKLDALLDEQEKQAAKDSSPEYSFRWRFFKEAERMLEKDVFNKIKDRAMMLAT